MSNCDDITRRFFELERWQRALDTAVDKRINRALLREMAKPETRIAHDSDALLAALKPMEWVYVYNYPKCPAWIDAYKGAGAYFTMKNLILFHNCQIHLDDGQVLDRDASMQHLSQLNANTAINGQQMFATMLRLISDNNFDWQE